MDRQELNGPSLNRLHDLAKAEAERLRNEAVDDFWRGANAVWQRGQTTAQRSASRLQARLARRAQGRITPSSTVTTVTTVTTGV